MIQVYSAANSMEAHHLRLLLEAEGIQVTIHGEMLEVARGVLPLTPDTLPSLWVADKDAARSREFLARHIEGPGESDNGGETTDLPESSEALSGHWRCQRCGERHEPQFTQCWKCGDARGGAAAEPLPVIPLPGNSLDYASALGWAEQAAANSMAEEDRARDVWADLLDEPAADFVMPDVQRLMPILPVPDLLTTARYYRDLLGFELHELSLEGPDPRVVLRRGDVRLGLCHGKTPAGLSLTMDVGDLDALFEQCLRRGMRMSQILDKRYQQQPELSLQDLNGVTLVFKRPRG